MRAKYINITPKKTHFVRGIRLRPTSLETSHNTDYNRVCADTL